MLSSIAEIGLKILFKTVVVIGALTVFVGEATKCPNQITPTKYSAEILRSRNKLLESSAYTSKMFSLSGADSIGIFLIDDDTNHLIKIMYADKTMMDTLPGDIYPIYDQQQKSIYIRSHREGCVASDVASLQKSDWKDSLKVRGTIKGVICSIKLNSTSIRNQDLSAYTPVNGIITFEYKDDEAGTDAATILNSIEYYREIISKSILLSKEIKPKSEENLSDEERMNLILEE
jgi:hypothetical protein